MSDGAFRTLWAFFDAILIPGLREPLSRISASVKQITGIWFHPSIWECCAALAVVISGYWLYVFIRGAKA